VKTKQTLQAPVPVFYYMD